MVPPSAIDLRNLDGSAFYDVEDHDGLFQFRWTRQRFCLDIPADGTFLSLRLAAPFAGTHLVIVKNDRSEERELLEGWQTLDIATDGAEELFCEIDMTFVPGGGDERHLGLMLRSVVQHDDPHRHQRINARHDNALLNNAEYASGTSVLTSVPQELRITTSRICNIANEKACVYCAWDWTKAMERGAPYQTPSFLDGMGRYFAQPLAITDCSYGELTIEPQLEEILKRTTEYERSFEFTSNGQALSPKVRRKLIDKTARVHVSLDASNASGFLRYRDHRFDLIVENLRALCQERGAANRLPEVFVSFIVMRSNMHDVKDFIALMKDIGVDRVTFRDLYREEATENTKTSHYGHVFDYAQEQLSLAELQRVGAICLEECAAVGLPVTLEWSAFAANVSARSDGAPICSEPWKTAYVLARGIMPCCYGREPIVRWDEIDQVNVEKGLEQALNAPAMVELRRDLSAGRLGAYCQRTRSCPLVKSHAASP